MNNSVSIEDIENIFQSLLTGIIPDRGLFTIAVGIEFQLNEIGRHIKGRGNI